MWYLYVLQSINDSILYTGITQNLTRRLAEHNAGKNRFTKGHIPWKIIYYEKLDNAFLARKREKYFKSAAGRRFIKKSLIDHNSAGSLPD